jgi:hypothetical protein
MAWNIHLQNLQELSPSIMGNERVRNTSKRPANLPQQDLLTEEHG